VLEATWSNVCFGYLELNGYNEDTDDDEDEEEQRIAALLWRRLEQRHSPQNISWACYFADKIEPCRSNKLIINKQGASEFAIAVIQASHDQRVVDRNYAMLALMIVWRFIDSVHNEHGEGILDLVLCNAEVSEEEQREPGYAGLLKRIFNLRDSIFLGEHAETGRLRSQKRTDKVTEPLRKRQRLEG
jgi:hypothetical protein